MVALGKRRNIAIIAEDQDSAPRRRIEQWPCRPVYLSCYAVLARLASPCISGVTSDRVDENDAGFC